MRTSRNRYGRGPSQSLTRGSASSSSIECLLLHVPGRSTGDVRGATSLASQILVKKILNVPGCPSCTMGPRSVFEGFFFFFFLRKLHEVSPSIVRCPAYVELFSVGFFFVIWHLADDEVLVLYPRTCVVFLVAIFLVLEEFVCLVRQFNVFAKLVENKVSAVMRFPPA